MELQECPSCGSMAGTHVDRCKFCGTDLPRGQTKVVAPPTTDARNREAPSDAGPSRADPISTGATATSTTSTASAASSGEAPPREATGSTLRPAPDLDEDASFARPRLAKVPLPPPQPPRRRGGRALGSVLAGIACFVVAWLLTTVVLGRDVDGAEADVLAGRGTWTTYVDPDGAYTIDLPSEPDVVEQAPYDDGVEREISGHVGGVRYLVDHWDLIRGATAGVAGERLFEQMPDILISGVGGTANTPIRTTVSGLPALQFDVDAGDTKWSATAIVTGRRVYLFAIGGPRVAVAAHARMVGSFRPLTPDR